MQNKQQDMIARVAAIIAAIILLQTLYFKFTAHPDSVYIFSQLGLAVITFVCCAMLAWVYRKDIPFIGGLFKE